MQFELRFVSRPRPQPIVTETIAAPSIEEAKRIARAQLKEAAYKITPPPDAVILVDAETREMLDVIERTP